MAITKKTVEAALRRVEDPQLRRDIVSLGRVMKITECEGRVGVSLRVVGEAAASADARAAQGRQIAEAIAHETSEQPVRLEVAFLDDDDRELGVFVVEGQRESASSAPSNTSKEASKQPGIPGVKKVIAVGAGKGGVGKSTIAVNLAVGLARKGHTVGLLDGDIYGPSMPTMLGLSAHESHVVGNELQPFVAHGIRAMTLGKLVDADKPLIWRGPMAHGAFQQLATQTRWGELDYLVIDLPPGTGDVPLTMSQLFGLAGAVLVCTPQRVAQDDAVRAAGMFRQLGIDVLGVVENMSYFLGDDGKEYDLFGRGGAERMAQRLGVPFLGGVPIHTELCANGDAGDPTANFEGNDALRTALESITDRVEQQVMLASMASGGAPTLTVR